MCIVTYEPSAEDLHWLKIGNTRIFARHTKQGKQAIVYSFSITSKTSAAMILPLPVVQGSGEDALNFIDMSDYPDFFDDIDSVCRPEYQHIEEYTNLDDMLECGEGEEISKLIVHDVGDYEASYVPTIDDFDRLDPCFRLPEEVWKKMPDYSDYGFAVFQLKLTLSVGDDETENAVHPMAFEFPTRNSQQLFYPTVHVHDGDYHNLGDFQHTFYCQRENARSEFKYLRDLFHGESPSPAEAVIGDFKGYAWYLRTTEVASQLPIGIDKCQGLVDPENKIQGMSLKGSYPNLDVWIGDVV